MHYKMNLIGRDGKISRVIDLISEDDHHAWGAVKKNAPEMPVELWQGTRYVGTLVPGKEPLRLGLANPSTY
jgi:hypothetical protein